MLVVMAIAWPFVFMVSGDPNGFIELKHYLSSSMSHRLSIWHFASDLISEAPFVGHGFDSSRYFEGVTDLLLVEPSVTTGEHKVVAHESPLMPLHPHSAFVQIWLELGMVGISMVVFAIFQGIRHLVTLDMSPFSHAALAASLVTLFANANVSFGLWQNWWVAGIWLCVLGWESVVGHHKVKTNSPVQPALL